MPSWKKVITSGSAANFSSIQTDTYVSASTLSISSFLYDNIHSTGSINNVLVSTATGVIWAPSSSGTGGGIGGSGVTNYIAFFNGSSTVSSSNIYQSGSTISINSASAFTPGSPEALLVNQPIVSSSNLITAYSNVNNYSQINVWNLNTGSNASSDYVATANNGDQNSNFVNMGINSSTFTGTIGGANDAYFYGNGAKTWFGNASSGSRANVYFFAGNFATSSAMMISSSGAIIINGTSSLNANARFQVAGNTYLSGGIYDSTNTLGSSSYALSSTSTGVQWLPVPVLITTVSASSQATLVANFSSSFNLYNKIRLEVLGFRPVTAGRILKFRTSQDGINYDTGSGAYNWGLSGMTDGASATVGSGSDIYIQIGGGTGVGNTSGRCLNATLEIPLPWSSSLNPTIYIKGTSTNNSGNFFSYSGGGQRLAAQLTKSIQFLFDSGNILSGIVEIWGEK